MSDEKRCGCVPKSKTKTVKRKTKIYWGDFAGSTALQGFDWVDNARCPAEKVLFVCLIALGVIFTVKDVTTLTLQFLSQEKQTKASIADNDTFTLNLTVCVDIETTSLKTPGTNVSKLASVQKLLKKFEHFDNITDYIGNLSDVGVPNNEWSDDDKSLVSVTTMMLANIIRIENLAELDYVNIEPENLASWGIFDKIDGDTNSKNVSEKPQMVIRPGTRESMFAINQFYAKKKIPFDQLVGAVGAALCKWMQLMFMPRSNNGIKLLELFKNQCRPDQVTWLGAAPKGGEWENLCIAPEWGTVQFDPKQGFLDVSFEHKLIHNEEGLDPDKGYKFAFYGATANLDLSGNRIYMVQTGSNTDILKLQQKQLTTMRISGYQKGISTSNDPCSGDLTKADCWLGCRAAFTYKNCRCWPLSGFGLPNRPDDALLCGSQVVTNNSRFVEIPVLTEVDTCGQIINQSVPDPDCKAACLPNCEYVLTSNTHDKFEVIPPAVINRTIDRLTVQYFQYPTYEQSLKMEGIDYFNQLGGALGLYIGCSFIALFHIIIFPTHMIMDCLAKRRKRQVVNHWFNSSTANDANGLSGAKFDPADGQHQSGFAAPPSYDAAEKGRDNPTVITVDDEE